ncbi:transcriptional regulator TrmB protein [Marine Group I thaumarchaeote SCGC AAA799-B03]|uniref:Transcriptional regulator TrmB protein n=4 Tax=Marine Group I TaxID=905826 RepID=A0A087S7S6_9ARCH|nr:transcriptional regulator TrmB protein [Marine Group I thaumarchaeote SCGC AAA799-D11]KFM17948.1 transcriptional regulator TrmB protein [Marine Group I thaumarchaeote SCGC RSA3]KFM21780.1 transcriptional regulator TrmB protein [Marine Group I thaumarchaeote SCGC AAA799-B03]
MTMEEALVEGYVFDAKHSESIDKINKILLQYGLTPNQSKVYLHLTKAGEKTASELSKNLKIPRTETYHLLNSLEQKGIIYSIFGKPSRFNSIPINEAMNILIDNEKKRVEDLESKKKTIVSLWETLPEFHSEKTVLPENRFQSLQGRNSILVKIEQMTKTATKSIHVLGTEANFIKFYHTDFVDYLKNTKSELEIVTTFSEKGNYVFEGIDLENIKKLDDNHQDNFSFIIKDESEVLFFVNNLDTEFSAMWTDSKSFVSTLESLFKMIWRKSKHILEKESAELDEKQYEHRLREIEQEKIILDYLHKNVLAKKRERN